MVRYVSGVMIWRRLVSPISRQCSRTLTRSAAAVSCSTGRSACGDWERAASDRLVNRFAGLLRSPARCLSDRPAQSGESTLSATTVVSTSLDADRRSLTVSWNDGEETSYPYVWLRDCCQCSTCFHDATGARRILFHELDLNVMPVNVETDSTTQEVVITWSDEHRSVFHYSWLLARSFRYAEQQARARWNGRAPKLWGSNMVDKVPEFEFDKLIGNDSTLYDWLTTLEETGFVVVNGAPQDQGQLHRIAARVAFLRRTNIGETSFEQTRETSTDVAHTVGSLELHNDLTHYYNVPGMKMVHCINLPTAEDVRVTQFVDGFQAAAQMKARHPDQFRLLSSTKLDFYNAGPDSILMSRHPTIKLDDAGEIVHIHYNTRSRDSYANVPLETVEPLYRALKTFASLLYDQHNLVEMRLKTGIIYCFDNWRVLHGRKAFNLQPGAEPVVERGYLDWDELRSRRRVLKRKLNIPDDEY